MVNELKTSSSDTKKSISSTPSRYYILYTGSIPPSNITQTKGGVGRSVSIGQTLCFFCVVLESPLFVPYNEAARRAIIVHAWSLYFTVSPTNTQRTEHGMRSNERPKVQRSLGTRRTLGYFFSSDDDRIIDFCAHPFSVWQEPTSKLT